MNFFRNLLVLLSLIIWGSAIVVTSASALDLSRLDPQEREMMEMVQGLNEEQQQQFFMEIMQELEKEVAKLPPAEQEKFLEEFWAEVEKEATQLEEKIKPIETPITETTPVVSTPVTQETKPAAKPIASSKIDEAAAIIDSLLTRLEKIISKSALIPDFSIKVSAWLKEGGINPSFDRWETLKGQIELLIQQLSKMKDRDPKTKEYKYLPELIKNEVVRNNLARVESVLRINEPNIEIPEFGSTTLTEKSSTAFKKALSCISEAFYKLGLPASLESIIGTYGPKAAKLSEEKTKSIQEAQKSAAPRPATPVITAGYEAPAPQYSKVQRQTPSYGSGYSNDALYQQTGQPRFGSADNQPSSTEAGTRSTGGGTGKTGGNAGGGASAPKAGGAAPMPKPAEGKKEAAKPAATDKPKKEDEKKKGEEDKRTEKSFDNLSSSLDRVTDILIDNNFKNIETLVLSTATPVNTQAANALQSAINAADRTMEKANALRVRFSKFSPEQKKYYKIDVDEIIAKTATINSIMQQIDAIKNQESTITADKRWAFLGEPQPVPNANLMQLVPVPASVYTLQKSLKELIDVLKSIR